MTGQQQLSVEQRLGLMPDGYRVDAVQQSLEAAGVPPLASSDLPDDHDQDMDQNDLASPRSNLQASSNGAGYSHAADAAQSTPMAGPSQYQSATNGATSRTPVSGANFPFPMSTLHVAGPSGYSSSTSTSQSRAPTSTNTKPVYESVSNPCSPIGEHPAKECFNAMAAEAEAILPLLEQFSIGDVKPEETLTSARAVLNEAKSGINSLFAVCEAKANLEKRYISLYRALCQQRQCVRQMRDNCLKLYTAADNDYKEIVAPYYKAIAESESKSARITQLEMRILQLESTVAKSESMMSAKDIEIRCLNDQLRKVSVSSSKGKAPMPQGLSQAPEVRVPPLRRDMLAQLETPRHQPNFDY